MLRSKYDNNIRRLIIYDDEIKNYEFYFNNNNRDYNRIESIVINLVAINNGNKPRTFSFLKLGYLPTHSSYISLQLFNDSHNIGYSLFENNYFSEKNSLIITNVFSEEDFKLLLNPILEYWKRFKEEEIICDE